MSRQGRRYVCGQTADLFVKWCKEQSISPGILCLEIYAILGKVYPKTNTLGLMGQSNAGKTYWASSFMPFEGDVGQTVVSNDFTYQKCAGKKLIHIPELTFTKPEQVEEAKKIFEGQSTTINIKNREPQLLQRTPVILTSNQTPWRQFTGEDKPFKNRMFLHQNLVQSKVLDDCGTPNPRFWQQIFLYIRDTLRWANEAPDKDDELMWEGDAIGVEAKIKSLANQYVYHLEQTWEEAGEPVGHHEKKNFLNVTMEQPNIGDPEPKILQYVQCYLQRIFDTTSDDYYWSLAANGEPLLMIHGEVYDTGMVVGQMTLDTIQENIYYLADILELINHWPNVAIYTDIKNNLKAIYKLLIKNQFMKLFNVNQNEARRELSNTTRDLLEHMTQREPLATSTPRQKRKRTDEQEESEYVFDESDDCIMGENESLDDTQRKRLRTDEANDRTVDYQSATSSPVAGGSTDPENKIAEKRNSEVNKKMATKILDIAYADWENRTDAEEREQRLRFHIQALLQASHLSNEDKAEIIKFMRELSVDYEPGRDQSMNLTMQTFLQLEDRYPSYKFDY